MHVCLTLARPAGASRAGCLVRPTATRHAGAGGRLSVCRCSVSVEERAAVSTTYNSHIAPWAIIDVPPESLRSTPVQRLWVCCGGALASACAVKAAVACTGNVDAGFAVAAGVAGWLFADCATGVYHWSVDNFGDGSTPLVGRQIAEVNPVLLHAKHASPSQTILRRSFKGIITSPGSLRNTHKWAHTKRSELPAVVVALQDAGLLLSRKAHGAHHLPPFKGNYCISSGLFNSVLDNSGVLDGLEHLAHDRFGITPRCWKENFDEDYVKLQQSYQVEAQEAAA